MSVTSKLLIWVLLIGLEVFRNWYMIENKKSKPNYLVSFILRGMAFILYGSLIWSTKYEWFTFTIFLYCVTSFFILFDPLLNITRGKDWYYVGHSSGWIDRFATSGKIQRVAYWTLKGLALYVCAETVITIYGHA